MVPGMVTMAGLVPARARPLVGPRLALNPVTLDWARCHSALRFHIP